METGKLLFLIISVSRYSRQSDISGAEGNREHSGY